MSQAHEAQFSPSTAERRKYHSGHLRADCAAICIARRQGNKDHATCREAHEDDNPGMVRNSMDEVRRTKLGQEGRNDICEQDNAFWNIGPNKIKGSREDDHVEDVVDQT